MRAWNHVLIALAVSFAATGCKFTTCSDDDEDCASSNGGSLFGGGDDAGGNASNGGDDTGGTNTGGTAGGSGGNGGTPAAEGGTAGDTTTPSAGAGGASGGSAGGGTGSGGATTDVVDMCSPDDPDLTECNACIQRTCCTEILACSNDLACGGDYSVTDAGIATSMSEIRCVSDENAFLADDANADEDDEVIGYAGDESVELASMRCAEQAGGSLSETTTELVQCMLHGVATESGEPPEFGDCAAACFGVDF